MEFEGDGERRGEREIIKYSTFHEQTDVLVVKTDL